MGTELWIAGIAVGLAVMVTLLPARRDASGLLALAGRPADGAVGGASGEGPAGHADVVSSGAPRSRGWRALSGLLAGMRQRARPPDLGLILVEVATLLRTGAVPERAWETVLARAGIAGAGEQDRDGVPTPLRAMAQGRWQVETAGGSRMSRLGPGRLGSRDARMVGLEAAASGAVAACVLTRRLGAPLAQVLERAAGGVDEAAAAEDSRRAALAGPRATARLLAALPVCALALGSAVGAHPLEVLTDGGWGSLLGAGGLVLSGTGVLVTGRMVRQAQEQASTVDEGLVADLAAAALACGASVPGCLDALGVALEEAELGVVGRALLLGASWEAAWRAPGDERWRESRVGVASCLRPAWEDGAGAAPLLEAWARTYRARRAARDQEAAQRLAVRLVAPLGACHLPSFIALGIVPVVVSIGQGMAGP